MAKRLIGLDCSPSQSYLAVLDVSRGEISKVQLFVSHREGLQEQLADLMQQLGSELRVSDRMATALPASAGFIRTLEFPFHDRKKIEASLPYTFSSRIPVAIEDCLMASLPPEKVGTGHARVTAAAVATPTVAEVIERCEQSSLPLHIVDLLPHALLAGVGSYLKNGLFLLCNSRETILARIDNGSIDAYRLLPQPYSSSQQQWLAREIKQLCAHRTGEQNDIFLAGDRLTDELREQLRQFAPEVHDLHLNLAGQLIPPAYVTATALALRAGQGKENRSFNFRRGSYALKGEWQKLKKPLCWTGSLLILGALILTTAAVLKQTSRSSQLHDLDQQLISVYRQTFPRAKTIVDVPLQMQSAIRELQNKNSQLSNPSATPLQVLKQLSVLPGKTSIEVNEFSYSPAEARITGQTDSFESLNSMTRTLETSGLFSNIQVADAQMALQGNKINFRLILPLAKEAEQ